MLPAWLYQQLSAPVFFVELPHTCFPLKEQWSTRPSADQRWNMSALHGLVQTPTSLSQLDAVQRRPIRIIDLTEDDLISHQIQPLGARREVGALTLFHRMYYGEAPELLCQLLPEHLQLDPRLRRSVRSHDLAVQIPRSNLVSHKRSVVPSAAHIWNSLPEYIPSLQKRACFKKEVNRYFGDN